MQRVAFSLIPFKAVSSAEVEGALKLRGRVLFLFLALPSGLRTLVLVLVLSAYSVTLRFLMATHA